MTRSRTRGAVSAARRGAVVLTLLAACGCAPGAEVWVDVHTDLVPGEEVDRVVVRVSGGASRSARVGPGEPFLEVARRFGPLAVPAGRHRVTVDLENDGAVVLTRSVSGSFSGTVVLTLWLTRACVGVVCPPPGDPAATECDDGECVRPDCELEPGGCIAPRCALDADCTAAHPACASNACVSGRCTLLPDDTRCAASEYCDPDVGCTPRSMPDPDAGTSPDAGGPPDAGPPDTGLPDAGPPPPRVLFLAEGATSWSTLSTSGDGPREPVEAAFTSFGANELVVFTRSELFVLRASDRTWVLREPRANRFPELDAVTVFESVTIAGLAPQILYVYSREGAHVYDWSAASRAASFQQFVAFTDFPAAEWGSPLAPPYWDMHAIWARPDDRGGWVTPAAGDFCPGGAPPREHATYVAWDGFGPAQMLVSSYDFACFRFVEETTFQAFPPFTLPGTPSDPWSVAAAAWLDGLFLFVSD